MKDFLRRVDVCTRLTGTDFEESKKMLDGIIHQINSQKHFSFEEKIIEGRVKKSMVYETAIAVAKVRSLTEKDLEQFEISIKAIMSNISNY